MSDTDSYVIFTDSTTDLTPLLINHFDLQIMSLSFSIDGSTYDDVADNKEMPISDFYNRLRHGSVATTAQIAPQEIINKFEPVLQGGKDIIYIAFSSALSGTYQSGCIAAKQLALQYPQRKIKVIDSLAASMGEGLLVCLAAEKKQFGYTIEQLEAWVLENRDHLCHWFTVDDLHFLKRGGRISAATAIIGSALSIKPIMHVDNGGNLTPVRKVRGRQQSLMALANELDKTIIDRGCQNIFISHGNCLTDAKFLENEIHSIIPKAQIYLNNVGPVIGSHSGPGTVALFFMGTQK